MIKQASISEINSRSECNVYDENGFLPLITAPMYSVVNEDNYKVFLDNKINVCIPRNINCYMSSSQGFYSYSLEDFKEFVEWKSDKTNNFVEHICIDTANGNMKVLHDAIRKAKEIHGDNLIIMAGNVASVDAFIELAQTGCDYIRIGIGGGGGCSTTSNTGVGQLDLEKLISNCYKVKQSIINNYSYWKKINIYKNDNALNPQEEKDLNLAKVKIVADGISTYIEQCETKYGFNDNGYAAINKLLFAGADLIMIGKLFAQCIESAGEKAVGKLYLQPFQQWSNERSASKLFGLPKFNNPSDFFKENKRDLFVKYSGMSTHTEQENYNDVKKPSEGFVQWLPVRWTLHDWLYGNESQDEAPYLSGWVNMLKSAMSYTNSKTLEKFKSC
jgi:hypothetical protein